MIDLPPYVPFYTSDFLAGTSGMTSSTKGVYITLLCLMYETESALTQKWDTLARRSGCTMSAFKKAVETLQDDGKITVTDAGIWSEKCDKHLNFRRERANSAKSAAKKRWEKSEQKQPSDDANASSAQCQPEPEPEPKKIEAIASTKNRASRLPENWVPNDNNIAHALSKQFSHEEIQNEADQFRDYHLAKGTTFKDWNAGWRTWIGNAVKFRNRRMAGNQGPGGYGQGGGIAGVVARRQFGG